MAEVYEGYDDEINIVKINGEESVSIAVNKESGANTVEVAKMLKENWKNIIFPKASITR